MSGPLDNYAAEFDRVAPALPGSQTTWLADLRAVSYQRFASLGFPTVRDEAWKYTSLAKLNAKSWRAGCPAVAITTQPDQIPGSHLLVFVNGRYEPKLSRVGALPPGVRLVSIAELLKTEPDRVQPWLRLNDDTRAFTALNTAFFGDGLLVHIPKECKIVAPIEVLWLGEEADGALLNERLWIEAEPHSEVTVFERFEGPSGGAYWRNAVGEVRVKENAKVCHVVCQTEGPQAFHFRQTQAQVERSGRYESHCLSFGGIIARQELNVTFEGEGGETLLNGLFAGNGECHLDNRTFIDHARPHCRSRELYKGILGGSARGVFDGKVLVRRDAQKTDSAQTNKNLLLTTEAEIDTKPSLEIYADDVKCSHGATTGQLDANALFYLRARGVGRAEAQAILTSAFAHEVMDAVPIPGLSERMDRLWLSQVLAGGTA